MKTKTKKRLKHLHKVVTKHPKAKRQIKRAHHVVTKRKLVRKKTSQRVLRGFFIVIATICTSGLAFAITTTKPIVGVGVKTGVKPGSVLEIPKPPKPPTTQSGRASWYAIGLPHPDALTCASRTYGRGTYLHVTNKNNGKSVTCLVNDYGPAFWTKRVIDLSRGSFRAIGNLGSGIIPVDIAVVGAPSSTSGVPLQNLLGTIMGYNLCAQQHDAQFCDSNRQKPGL
jgi:rare lipoprotein A